MKGNEGPILGQILLKGNETPKDQKLQRCSPKGQKDKEFDKNLIRGNETILGQILCRVAPFGKPRQCKWQILEKEMKAAKG